MYIPYIMINENDYPHLLSILITKQPTSDDDDSKEEYYVLGPFDSTKLKEVQDIVELLEKYMTMKAKVEIANIRYSENNFISVQHDYVPIMNNCTYIHFDDDKMSLTETIDILFDGNNAEMEIIASAVENTLLNIYGINNQS